MAELTAVEQALVAAVGSGELLDLRDAAVPEARARPAWPGAAGQGCSVSSAAPEVPTTSMRSIRSRGSGVTTFRP